MRFIALTATVLITVSAHAVPSPEDMVTDPLDPSEGAFLDVDPETYQEAALAAYDQGDFLEAARSYLVYLHLRPGDETAIYNLACCYGLLGENELAAGYLTRAVLAGFTDLDHIRTDPDFDPVRGSGEFSAAMDLINGNISSLRESLGEQFLFDAQAIRQCRVRFPEDFDPGVEYPLVIGLHGLGDRPDGFIRLYDEFEEHDFIFACPQAIYPVPLAHDLGYSWFLWDPASELGYHSNVVAVEHVMALLDDLEKNFLISRVYLLGFSQGCTMVWNTGLTHPDRFDGLIGFGGWLDTGFLTTDVLDAASGTSVFIAHGADDPAVPFEAGEQAFTILSGLGCSAEIHAFEGGHEIDRETLGEAEEWMRSLR